MTTTTKRRLVSGLCYVLLFLFGMRAAVVYGADVRWHNYTSQPLNITNTTQVRGYWVQPGGTLVIPIFDADYFLVIETNATEYSLDFSGGFIEDTKIRVDSYESSGGIFSAIEYDNAHDPEYLPTFIYGFGFALVLALGGLGIRVLAASGKQASTEL